MGAMGMVGFITGIFGSMVKAKALGDEAQAKTDAARDDIYAKQLQIAEQSARNEFNNRQLDRQAQEASGIYSVQQGGRGVSTSLSDLYDINYGYGMQQLKNQRETDYNNKVLNLEIQAKRNSIGEINQSRDNAVLGTYLTMGSQTFNLADTNSGGTAKAGNGSAAAGGV